MATDALLILDWLKFGVSIVFTLASLFIYLNVRKDEKGLMNSFQLNHAKVIQEYKIMFAANLLMVVTMFFYLYNGLEASSIGLLLGKGLYAVYILMITIVLVRWVRRFQ